MGSQRRLFLVLGLAALLLIGWAVLDRGENRPPPVAAADPAGLPAADRASDVRAVADRVVAALQARDGPGLAALVHPDGVRLSPSAYVDVAADQRLRPEDVANLWRDPVVRTWGHADASGDPIDLTPAAYASRYIVDQDYSKASVSVNGDTSRGTTVDNAAAVYPDATRLEYFRQGADATDWSALRLVLLPVAGEWRLVGIIHDAWTP